MPDDIIAAIESRLKRIQSEYERLVEADIETSVELKNDHEPRSKKPTG